VVCGSRVYSGEFREEGEVLSSGSMPPASQGGEHHQSLQGEDPAMQVELESRDQEIRQAGMAIVLFEFLGIYKALPLSYTSHCSATTTAACRPNMVPIFIRT